MSVIAVRKYEDRIVMASDLQTSWGDSKLVDVKNQMYLDPAKIWQHNGVTVGSAGHVSGSTLFRVFTKTHRPGASTIEGLIDFLVEFTDWAKKKDSAFKLENHFLIVFEKKMYQCIDYDVQEIPEYNAVGSGMFLALGAMYKGSDPEEAIEVAKQFDLFCSGKTDVIIISLDEEEKEEKVVKRKRHIEVD